MAATAENSLPGSKASEVLEQFLLRCPLPLNTSLQAGLKNLFEQASRSAKGGDWPGEGLALLDWYQAGCEMAGQLASLHMDEDALATALLYPALRTGHLDHRQVQAGCGKSVAGLALSMLRLAQMDWLQVQSPGQMVLGEQHSQQDQLRRMLVAMIDDPRIILLGLVEKCCLMRHLKESGLPGRRLARQVFLLHAPMAGQMGIGQVERELEDLCFAYLYPRIHRRVSRLIRDSQEDRHRYLQAAEALLKERLNAAGLQAQVSGRFKSVSSIWMKMRRKGLAFSQLHDVQALRILVPDMAQCYGALGVVHTLWAQVRGQYDDYISTPKENGYQALHTAVVGPENRFLEVQIRSHAMHEEAEYGICAHWRYKEGEFRPTSERDAYERKLAWLRQLLEWHDQLGWPRTLETLQSGQAMEDRIYVFTPRNHVVGLPLGSTPLDFAYRIHTQVGHHCRGALVNGKSVPLSWRLQNGDHVEILVADQESPRLEWLRDDLRMVHSASTKAKIQAWFREQSRSEQQATGQALMEQECRRLGLKGALGYREVARMLGYRAVEQLHLALGSGEVGLDQVIRTIHAVLARGQDRQDAGRAGGSPKVQHRVFLPGLGVLPTSIAGCCRPLPGEEVAAYITRRRGLSLHQRQCPTLARLNQAWPGQTYAAAWVDCNQQRQVERWELEVLDRPALLRDLGQLLHDEGVAVSEVHTLAAATDAMRRLRMSLVAYMPGSLARACRKLDQMPDVIKLRRLS